MDFEDIKSYKKLIPALKDFPKEIIVTAEDDVYWQKDNLENLISSYKQNPIAIHCSNITRIRKTTYGYYDSIEKNDSMIGSESFSNKLVGNCGVLYHPHSLDSEVFDLKKAFSICPTSDDIWFWSMALKNKMDIQIQNHLC